MLDAVDSMEASTVSESRKVKDLNFRIRYLKMLGSGFPKGWVRMEAVHPDLDIPKVCRFSDPYPDNLKTDPTQKMPLHLNLGYIAHAW